MHRFLIHIFNGLWLIIVLIGVPAITSMQLGKIRLSSVPEFQMLTLGGLGVGALGNFVAIWMVGGKGRGGYWKWMLVHVAALLVYLLVFGGRLHFDWLKEALLWFKRNTK